MSNTKTIQTELTEQYQQTQNYSFFAKLREKQETKTVNNSQKIVNNFVKKVSLI
jgi:hypothetical protein